MFRTARNPGTTVRWVTGTRRGWWSAGAAGALTVALAAGLAACGGDGDGQTATAESFSHVHGVQAPGWAPEVVLLATHHGLVRIEDDQWSYVGQERHDFMGFAAHPGQPGVLYGSGHPAPDSDLRNPLGFVVSTDGGATWEVRSLAGEADFHAMTVGAAGSVIYGWNVTGRVGLYRSVDDGHTWQVLDAAALHASEGMVGLAAHPDDADVLWAATLDGLLRSDDAGATWQPVVDGTPVTAVAYDPADPERMYAYTAPPGDGMLTSVDGGRSWSATGWALESPQDAVGHIAVDPGEPGVLHAGTFGEDLYRSDDGGTTWRALARGGAPVGDHQ
jgi:hypothetical protein